MTPGSIADSKIPRQIRMKNNSPKFLAAWRRKKRFQNLQPEMTPYSEVPDVRR